ncbi:MAG: hypothetical protein GY913_14810 [Proteobacteria bacterium]|nr:hypothetical protein [Pseudomonadota bacterium]MCP4918181.1 hypothetical protein [Pseudomonadota bacterium]
MALNTMSMNKSALRNEAYSNVEGIRIAQLAYHATFDTYVACPPTPRAVAELDRTAVDFPWDVGDDPRAMCWAMLGWVPDGQVRGTYSVEVHFDPDHPETEDFVVNGWIDIDADGEAAHVQASRDDKVHATTDDDVY